MPCSNIEIGAPGYLSGSTMANLYGCGFGTRMDCYNRLIGKAVYPEFSDEAKRSMDFGTWFEEPVANYFCHLTGLKIKKVGDGKRAYWKNYMPYLICHPDRLGVGKDKKGRRFAVEIKCVSPYSEGWGEEWTADVPDYYYIQCQTYFATGVPCDVVYLVCLRGNRVYIYEILPDEAVINDIRKKAREFKEATDRGEIPEPETYKEAARFYGSRVDKEAAGVGANDDVLKLYNDIVFLHNVAAQASTQEEQLKQNLMEMLGEAPAFVTTDGKKIKRICYWSETTKTSLDEERLAAEHPELDLTNYETTKTSRSFRVAYPRGKGESNG